jgi:ferredoxin
LSFSYVIITYVNVTYQKGGDDVRVVAYTQKCIASGNCVLACSDVFEQRDSDGTVHVLNERPALVLLAKVRQVVDLCPAQVFTIEDEANEAELVVVEDDRTV